MTTQATHTPGPWYSTPTAGHEMHGQSAIASEANGKTVAIAYDGKADAHLIAAAPDLLEALQNAAEIMSGEDYSHVKADMVRAICRRAISKAEGSNQ